MHVGPAPLVVMVGGIASGKSTAARFIADFVLADPAALVASDDLRAQIFGSAEIQGNPADIHGLARKMAEIRLAAGLPVVYDATSLLRRDRAPLVELARSTGAPVMAVWADATFDQMSARNAARDRVVPDVVVQRMAARASQVRESQLRAEGFDLVVRLDSRTLESTESVARELSKIHVSPAGWDGSRLAGPFDVVGDIHGCRFTLAALMAELGYSEDGSHPEGRTMVSVGDVVDRGAHTWDTWGYVAELYRTGRLLLVRGNHEAKHGRYLEKLAAADDPVRVVDDLEASQGAAHGLTAALREALVRGDRDSWVRRAAEMRRLPSHISLAGHRLLVCHGAARPDLVGRAAVGDREAESWFLYGAPTGETTADGLPVRSDWQQSWTGEAFVVAGHSTVSSPRFVAAGGGSVNIDTGCAFGPSGTDVHSGESFAGRLTAFRFDDGFSPSAGEVSSRIVSVAVDPRDLAAVPV